MQVRPLPGTDLRLSEISFGAGTAAGLMIRGERADQRAAVEAALEAGINHFDTAPLYGWGCSEVNLGSVLHELHASDVVVTTKFSVPAPFLVTGSIGARIRQSVQESLTRLRRDHIDILLMHNATHLTRNLDQPDSPAQPPVQILPHLSLDDVLGPDGAWASVEQLKAEGLVRYFGVSGQDNDPAAIRALIGAGRITVFNQPFNLLNPSAGFPAARDGQPVSAAFVQQQTDFIDFDNVMEFARANGVGVSVISPVAAGALTEDAIAGRPALPVSGRARRFPRPGQYEREVDLARRLAPVAHEFGASLAELAYRFVLSAPGVTTVVGGFSSPEHTREATDAASKGPLGPDVVRAIHAAWYAGAPG